MNPGISVVTFPYSSGSLRPAKARATRFDSLCASIPMYSFFMACPVAPMCMFIMHADRFRFGRTAREYCRRHATCFNRKAAESTTLQPQGLES